MIEDTSISGKMHALQLRYVERLVERSTELQKLLRLTERGELGAQEREELKFQAHKLAGTGTTFGYPAISKAGADLEALLAQPPEDGKHLVGHIRALLQACESAITSQPKEQGSFGRAKQEPTTAPQPAKPTLLIVDDDETVVTLLSTMFGEEANVLTAHNSDEALELLKLYKPDLMLLDDMMPGGISGLRMLEDMQLSPDTKDMPVIFITASDRPQDVMRGLMAGAIDYIVKPFDAAAVSAKVSARLTLLKNDQILIADDDETIRELLSHKFRAAGCKTVTAEDGRDAFEKMKKMHFSLAVLDRMMPGFDGMTLLGMMRETPALAHLPVVFLTARHYGADVLEGLNNGAADYVTKPFNPDELVLRCLKIIQTKKSST